MSSPDEPDWRHFLLSRRLTERENIVTMYIQLHLYLGIRIVAAPYVALSEGRALLKSSGPDCPSLDPGC